MRIAESKIVSRVWASTLALSLALGNGVIPAHGAQRVAGSIRVSGPAFVASGDADWAPITAPRPLLAGDRLKTGKDGYLVADMGQNGLIGLFGDAEVATTEVDSKIAVDVLAGKVAFHLEPGAAVVIRMQDSEIVSGTGTADGYVEIGTEGVPPVVVMEGGALLVRLPDGGTKTLASGERLELGEPQDAAAAGSERRGAAAPSSEAEPKKESAKKGGLTWKGWTAIAVVTAGVAGGIAAVAGGGGGGGGGGNNSPSGD